MEKLSTTIISQLLLTRERKRAGFLLLIDPDSYEETELLKLCKKASEFGADAILIGGSMMLSYRIDEYIRHIKAVSHLPVILFPGSAMQVSGEADAMLFLSLMSGRNPEYLIGHHVTAAPAIKALGLETIPTAYLLIESGKPTTVSYVTGTMPIPRHKPNIAAAHALAAEYLGMKFCYLEAGSGAELSVPEEMISRVKSVSSLPLIVGGGIRTPEEAASKVQAGADFIVIGNAFEHHRSDSFLRNMIDAVHSSNS
ncbi:MAG: geranylgeranylglyceryl/heptaprenylglyceryl phosphate synthase [Chloroherpetonaceae bacterium]|nr:geranylgeranylglyceryl/heptaprenylglyceryl phosphate synthase [Chloroherpetonaceae bacterium]